MTLPTDALHALDALVTDSEAAPDPETADVLDALAADLVTAAPWPDRAPDPDQMGFF